MLNFYQELNLLPQEEIPIHFLWSKVFQQLHLALVEVQDPQNQVPVGVSFPEYVVLGHSRHPASHDTRTSLCSEYSVLGSKCRLFAADQATLERLNISQWLARLADYVHVTSIRPVPEKLSGYAIYQRQQVKTNPERLARRYARRHGVALEQAMQHYQSMDAVRIATPFIRLRSLSSEHTFCLWIKKTEVPDAVTGVFSTYGLSAQTTVPEF